MDENIEAECDEEIARISSQAVRRTPQKMNNEKDNSNGSNNGHAGGRLDPPRPMSWDGELSDNDAIVSVT